MSSSWLRNHVRHWVVPGLKLLAKNHRQDLQESGHYFKTISIAADKGRPQPTTQDLLDITTADDYKPIGLRPSKRCKRPEAGLVYAAVSSFYPRHPLLRARALEILRECDPKLWMDSSRLAYAESGSYNQADVVHSIIKSSWRALKDIADGRTIILPGRDVWPWEILAQRDKYPTIYDPRISRLFCFAYGKAVLGQTGARNKLLRKVCLEEWGVDLSECIIFDTGFAGSIPAAIRGATRIDVPHLMLSSEQSSLHNEGREWTQIFPNHKGARSKVLCIEYFPKYQKSGTVMPAVENTGQPASDIRKAMGGDVQPVQYLNDPFEFIKAAALTIWMWHNQSPRYIRQGKHQEIAETEVPLPTKIHMQKTLV